MAFIRFVEGTLRGTTIVGYGRYGAKMAKESVDKSSFTLGRPSRATLRYDYMRIMSRRANEIKPLLASEGRFHGVALALNCTAKSLLVQRVD
jgi:hypothetical protein